MVQTPNKDFTMHISGWIQWDNVWWSQSPACQTAPGSQRGRPTQESLPAPLGGIGDLKTASTSAASAHCQRARSGKPASTASIPAFENNQFNTVGLDEMWVGADKIPLIGTLRVGHVKNPMGLEGDMTASSRCMTFMERSSYSEAIELNQNFVTGLWFSNTYFDDRMTWSSACVSSRSRVVHRRLLRRRPVGRAGPLTGLPLYEDEGRHLLHLGISGGWRNGTTNLAISPFATRSQLRARPELRDDDPPAGRLSPTPIATAWSTPA